MAQKLRTDWTLFSTVLALVSFGLLMLYSASSITAQEDPRYNSSWYFVIRQVGFAVFALVAMMALKKTSYRKLNHPAVAFGAIGVVLLLLGVAYAIGTVHHRFLRFGPVGVQPSELAKPALVVFLAFFVTWKRPALNSGRYSLLPAALAVGFLIFGVVVADLGTAVVLGATAAVVFFVAGLGWRYCAVVGVLAFIGLALFVALSPYRLARVVQFCDPQFKIVSSFDRQGRVKAQMEKSLTTRDTGYQAQMAKIALGDGGPLGLGLMNGKQKLLYLPEAHTDFIYAVVGEELGILGAVGLLVGFGVIFWRGMRAAWLIGDDFGRYLALGITVLVVVQGMINMSVVLGLMPTKGIPLPMISYGGSSLVSTLVLLGILMNVSEHAG